MAFYKGTMMPLVGVGACVSIQFGVVEYVKRVFRQQSAHKHLLHPAPLTSSQLYASGAAGGMANSVLAAPIEQVRIRLQTQKAALYNGPLDCMRK